MLILYRSGHTNSSYSESHSKSLLSKYSIDLKVVRKTIVACSAYRPSELEALSSLGGKPQSPWNLLFRVASKKIVP